MRAILRHRFQKVLEGGEFPELVMAAYQIIEFGPVALVIVRLAMEKARSNKSFSRIIARQELGGGF